MFDQALIFLAGYKVVAETAGRCDFAISRCRRLAGDGLAGFGFWTDWSLNRGCN
jgi:hypothetical protein